MTEKKVSFWRIFWASLTATLIVSFLGWMIVLMIVGGLFSDEPIVKDKKVLHVTLSGEIGELSESSIEGSSISIKKVTGVNNLLLGFKKAAEDDDVKGLYVDLKDFSCGYGTAHEIREAILEFRKSGKFVIAYLSGESVSQKQYYISSAADKVYGFPTSVMEFVGLGSEITYFKGTLDKLGVEMQVIRGANNDFKSAVEPYFRDAMSDSSRLQMQELLGDLWSEIRGEIAKSRHVSASKLNAIANELSIRRVEDALKYKLIDGVKYRDEVEEIVRKKGGDADMTNLMAFEKYARNKFKNDQLINSNANIAVIVAEGAITVNGDEMSSEKVCRYFREARNDKKIKAVVFRVNSPGGSALASEEIWREVNLTAKKKKVIVSMGDVAASGGYYISTPANYIFAEPTTITGSIGVFGVIPFTGKMLEDYFGVTFDRVQTNTHSVLSTNRRLSEQEMGIIQDEVNAIYAQFKQRVADGRKLSKQTVEVLARGRVWSGSDAKRIGLVDEIGNLDDAIAYAKKKAGLKEAKLKYWPKVKEDPVEELLEQLMDEESVQGKLKQSKLPKVLTDAYSKLENLEQLTGVQMRLPFLIEIN